MAYELTNEEERNVRAQARADRDASWLVTPAAQAEAREAEVATFGEEGEAHHNAVVNAELLLEDSATPDALYWESAKKLSEDYAKSVGVPYLASETLKEWNVDRKPFANGRDALARIVSIYRDPRQLISQEYMDYAKGRAEVEAQGGDTQAWLYDQAIAAGYKMPSAIDAGYLPKDERYRYDTLYAQRVSHLQKDVPSVVQPGVTSPVVRPQAEPLSAEEQEELTALGQKAMRTEVANRYAREMQAKNAFGLWMATSKGFSPEANELIRRAFIGGEEGFDIEWDKYEDFIRNATETARDGKISIPFLDHEHAKQLALVANEQYENAEPYALLSKVRKDEVDSLIVMLGAARGRVVTPQWWKDTTRGFTRMLVLPVEGAIDYLAGLNGVDVKVDEQVAAMIRNREQSFFALTLDERKQRELKFALEDATSPLEYEDYGWGKAAVRTAVEQIPLFAWMVGVPALAGAVSGGTAAAPTAMAVQGAFALAYARDTRDLILREGGDPFVANLAGFASGAVQSALETSKVELFMGKGITEQLYKASVAKMSKALTSVFIKETVKKYGSLEIAKAVLQYGGAVALNGFMETLQEGAQKATEQIAKNGALIVDGQEVTLFSGVGAEAWKEMKNVFGGMLLTQGASSLKPLAGGIDFVQKSAVVDRGLFANMVAEGATASEATKDAKGLHTVWRNNYDAGANAEERIDALQSAGLTRGEAEGAERYFKAVQSLQTRHRSEFLRMVAEDIMTGGRRFALFSESESGKEVWGAEEVAKRMVGVLEMLGLEGVTVEAAADQEGHAGNFVVTFGKDGAKFQFGLQSEVTTDLANANAANSAYDTLKEINAEEVKDVDLASFTAHWMQDAQWRDEVIKKYRLGTPGHYRGDVRTKLRVVDSEGKEYTAELDGLMSLAIGERATSKTAVHESMHMLLGILSKIEAVKGADSLLAREAKIALLQAFVGTDAAEAYTKAREANAETDTFWKDFYNGGGEERFANVAARSADADIRSVEDFARGIARQQVMSTVERIRDWAGGLLDRLLQTDGWRMDKGEIVSHMTEVERRKALTDATMRTLRESAMSALEAHEELKQAEKAEREATLADTLAKLQEQENAELAKAKNAHERKKIHARYRTLRKEVRRNARMGEAQYSVVASPNDVQVSVNDNAEGVDYLRYSDTDSQEYAILRSAIYERDRQFQSIHRIKPLNWGFAYTANNVYLYNRKDYGEFDIIHGWYLDDDISAEIAEVRRLFNEEIKQKRGKRTPKIANGWDALRWVRRAVDSYNSLTDDDGGPIKRNGRMDDLVRGYLQGLPGPESLSTGDADYSKTYPNDRLSVTIDPEARAQAQQEYDAVVAQYKDTDQWLKAPNGKPTNLTERQWVQVRTPSFKRWFGDWENDPANASKVVDENGEPLVVYHGTTKFGFTTFNARNYFATNIKTAKEFAAYAPWDNIGVRSLDSVVKMRKRGWKNRASLLKWINESGLEYELDPTNYDGEQILTLKMNRESRKFTRDGDASYEDVALISIPIDENARIPFSKKPSVWDMDSAFRNSFDEWKKTKGGYGIYGVFLNIRDPYAIDVKGKRWHEVYDKDLNSERMTTDEAVVSVFTWKNNDGVFFKDVREGSGILTNDFIPRDPSQIKSATDNIGTFDAGNNDIRYSIAALDSTHRDLYERYKAGDETALEEARQMVREAAAKAMPNTKVVDMDGLPRMMYHETNADNIHVFNLGLGTHAEDDSETPYGIFTKSTDANIGLGNKQMELFVNAKKTLIVADREAVKRAIPELVPYYDEIKAIDAHYSERFDQAETKEFEALEKWQEANPDADMDAVYPIEAIANDRPANIDSEEYLEAFNEGRQIKAEWKQKYAEAAIKCKEILTDYLRTNGYDSMYFRIDEGTLGRKTDSFIVLDPNQVKSADPFTFDDAGNLIPLSERFNLEKDDVRYSISGLFTGSAADYAQRLEDGTIENGPSLHYIGEGVGAQVYGYGLYGSSQREEGERFANEASGRKWKQEKGKPRYTYIVDGNPVDTIEAYGDGAGVVARQLQYGKTIDAIRSDAEERLQTEQDESIKEKVQRVIQFLDEHSIEVVEYKPEAHRYLYEQTFFTNRADGDESHLLNWFAKVEDEQLNWLEELGVSHKTHTKGSFKGSTVYSIGDTVLAIMDARASLKQGNLYGIIAEALGSPKAATEWLVAKDIDGVKYPVNASNGSDGWNYVSFRDDNIRVDHKWVDGEMRFSVSLNPDLSIPENAKAFKEYIKALPAAPNPERLKDGSPKTTLEWFEQNMVGKTYSFDIPGHGHFTFTPTMGHIGRLVCKGGYNPDGSKIVKGRIKKAYEGNWIDAVKRGEISASDVEGWDNYRARSLPIVDNIFNTFDCVLFEKNDNAQDNFIFLKKFKNVNGRPNSVVMIVNKDGITLGPLSSHVKDVTTTWLKNKKLVITNDGELYNRGKDNSVSKTPLLEDNTESNSSNVTTTIPNSDADVNRNSVASPISAESEYKGYTDGVTDEGAVRYSIASYEEGGREYLVDWLNKKVKDKRISREDSDDLVKSADEICKIAKQFADSGEFAHFSAWSKAVVEVDDDGNPYFGVLRPNGDYAYNFDFSTVCKKRRPLDKVFNALVDDGTVTDLNIDTFLSETNIPKVQEIIKRHGLEVACALCFVDSKRYKIGEVAKKFSTLWNGVIALQRKGGKPWKDAVSLAKKKQAGKYYETDKKTGDMVQKKPTFYDRAVLLVDANADVRMEMDASQLISGGTMDEFARTNPKVFSLYRSFGGVSKAKDSHGDVPWNNDILRSFKSLTSPKSSSKTLTHKNKGAELLNIGGVRLQSFTDFIPAMFFDYVQMVTEMAAAGLPCHVYTKELDFVRLFCETRMKINMSLVPAGTGVKWLSEAEVEAIGATPFQGKDGKPVMRDGKVACFDLVDETFPIAEAFANRDAKGNVGTIMVGVSDEHIALCLDDPRIDMVIPYHKSSLNADVAKMRGIDQYRDYTNFQRTKDPRKKEDAEEDDSGEAKKMKGDFGFYQDLKKTNNPRKTAANYVKWCKKKGFLPKFSNTKDGTDFTKHENYYKLLADFRLYDAEGNYSPQQFVVSKWPKDMVARIRTALSHDQYDADLFAQEIDAIKAEVKEEVFGLPKANTSTAKANTSKAKAKAVKANGKYQITAMTDAVNQTGGVIPDMNDLLSHPALETILSGVAMDAGHRVSAREVVNFARDFGVEVSLQNAKETADRINKRLWKGEYASRMSERAEKWMWGGGSPFERSSGIAQLFADLDQDVVRSLAEEIALTRGVARGAKVAARLASEAEVLKQMRAEELLAQSGYSASTIEQHYGIDLVDTILAQLDAEAKMSKDQIAERAKKRQEAAEKRQQETLEEVTTVGERESELTEEKRNEWAEVLERLRNRTKAHTEVELKRREIAKKKIEERKRKQAEGEANQPDDFGEDDTILDAEDGTAVFDVAGRTVDLLDPMELVWFVEYMVADQQLKRESNEEDLKGLAKDAFYLRNVALTLGNVINRLAEGMTYGPARERVKEVVAQIGAATSLRSIERLGIRALNELHKSRIVASRKAIRKAMIEGGDVDFGSAVAHLVGLNKAIDGIKSRLKVGKSDFERKVLGDVEAQLRAIKRVLKLGDVGQMRLMDKVDEDLARILKNAGSKENAEMMRDYMEAKRLQAALNTYGGWNHLPIGKLLELAELLSKQVNGELEAHAQKVAEREMRLEEEVKAFVDAIEAGHSGYAYNKASRTLKQKVADWADNDLGNLALVLERLASGAKGEVRDRYLRLANNLRIEFAEAAQRERKLKLGYQQKVGEILRKAYGSEANGVKHLYDFIPEDKNAIITAQIQRDEDGKPIEGKKAHQNNRLTYGQVLQLWASVKQEDYKLNAAIWGRDGEAFKAMESCLTEQDIAFFSNAQAFMRDIFPDLQKTYFNIVGYTVGSTPDYWPVKVHTNRDTRPADVRVYSPFVASMQPRVRHGLDLDERADALAMFTSRLDEYAHMQAYGEMSEHIVPLFGNHKVRNAIRDAYGDKALNQVDSKIRDTILGVKARDGMGAIMQRAMTITSVFNLGFNIVSVAKQSMSTPSMALRIGIPKMAKFYAENFFDFGSEAYLFLKNSDGYKSRYGNNAFNVALEEALNGADGYAKRVKFRKFVNAAMHAIGWADWMASRAVAIGYFKERVAQLEAQGYTHQEAMRVAAIDTFDVIESTMQTGQTHHQTEVAKHSELARSLLQFQNSPYQQSRYFWRALGAILNKEEGGWGKMGNVLATNLLTGIGMEFAIQLLNALMGTGFFDDDDEEKENELKSMAARLTAAVCLPFTAAPLLGGIGQMVINVICGASDHVGSREILEEVSPAAISTLTADGMALYHVGEALAEGENIEWALNNLAKKMLPPYRHGVKAIEGWTDWEQPEKE